MKRTVRQLQIGKIAGFKHHITKSKVFHPALDMMTTILGMVPMAVGSGEGAEMWRPMGIAVIGGLTFSTILTLLFVPALYCVFAYNGVKNNRRKIRKQFRKQQKNQPINAE